MLDDIENTMVTLINDNKSLLEITAGIYKKIESYKNNLIKKDKTGTLINYMTETLNEILLITANRYTAYKQTLKEYIDSLEGTQSTTSAPSSNQLVNNLKEDLNSLLLAIEHLEPQDLLLAIQIQSIRRLMQQPKDSFAALISEADKLSDKIPVGNNTHNEAIKKQLGALIDYYINIESSKKTPACFTDINPSFFTNKPTTAPAATTAVIKPSSP